MAISNEEMGVQEKFTTNSKVGIIQDVVGARWVRSSKKAKKALKTFAT